MRQSFGYPHVVVGVSSAHPCGENGTIEVFSLTRNGPELDAQTSELGPDRTGWSSAMKYRTACHCGADHKALILARVTFDASGCWVWKNKLDREGYGRITHQHESLAAHRFSYHAFRGDFDASLVIDHLCRNRACTNPWHLEPVTHAINIARGEGLAPMYAARTYCKRGHLLVPNKRNKSRHNRACEECRKYANRERQLAHDGLPAGDDRHGTVNGYTNWHCRCVECRRAWAAHHLTYMHSRQSDLGGAA